MGNLCCKKFVWLTGSQCPEKDFEHNSITRTELKSNNEEASCAIDELLEGRMDLEVVLPDARRVRLSVERRMPMMDVLVRAASAHKLSPGGLVIKPPSSSDESYHFGRYQPSTPIGALDVATVFVIPKKDLYADGKRMHPPGPRRRPPPTREQETFRMSIHLPSHQLAVARVSGDTTISQLMARVCDERGLNPQRYRFVHPQCTDKPISKDTTMREYGETEITLLPLSRINEQMCFQNSHCFGFFCGESTLQSSRSVSKDVSEVKKCSMKKQKRPAPSPPTSSTAPQILTDDDNGRTDDDEEGGANSCSSSSGVSSLDGGGLPTSTLSLVDVGDDSSNKPKKTSSKYPAPPPPPTLCRIKSSTSPVCALDESSEIAEPFIDVHRAATTTISSAGSVPPSVTRQEIVSHIEGIFHSFLEQAEHQQQPTTPEGKEEAVDQPARAPEVIGHPSAADERTSAAASVDVDEETFFGPVLDHETGSLLSKPSDREWPEKDFEVELSHEIWTDSMRDCGAVDTVSMPVTSARTLRQTHSLPNGADELLAATADGDSQNSASGETLIGGRSPFVSRSLSCEPTGSRNGTLRRALIDIPLLYVDPLLEQNSLSNSSATTTNKAYTSSLRSSTNKTRFKPPQIRTIGKCRQRLPPEVRKECDSLPTIRFEISNPKTETVSDCPSPLPISELSAGLLSANDSIRSPVADVPCSVSDSKTHPLVPSEDETTQNRAVPPKPVVNSIVCTVKVNAERKHIQSPSEPPPPPPPPSVNLRSHSKEQRTEKVQQMFVNNAINPRDALLQEIANFGGRRALKPVREYGTERK